MATLLNMNMQLTSMVKTEKIEMDVENGCVIFK